MNSKKITPAAINSFVFIKLLGPYIYDFKDWFYVRNDCESMSADMTHFCHQAVSCMENRGGIQI